MSLILHGPTRLGKTQWARSLGRHIYMQGMFNADNLDPDATYAIFDDIVFEEFKSWKQWLGCQVNITVTDKYVRKKNFKGGIPAIYLTNIPMPHWKDRHHTYDQLYQWLMGNCVVVDVTEPLFVQA